MAVCVPGPAPVTSVKGDRIVAVPEGGSLLVHSGARTMTLSWRDLEAYLGARGSRGGLLPRGWQKVEALSVE